MALVHDEAKGVKVQVHVHVQEKSLLCRVLCES